MDEWLSTTWGDVITLQRGYDITRAAQALDGSIPVVSSGGVNSFHDKAMDAGPGAVIGRKGTLGKVYFVDGPFWPHDTTLWVQDFKGSDPRFVYYALHTLDLGHMNVGTASPTLNRNHVHPLPVLWPATKAEQRAIAEVLGALDDKIAANQREVATAEGLMVALIGRADGMARLSDLAEQSTRSVRASEFPEQVAHFSLPAFDAAALPEITDGASIKSNKFLIDGPCVLMSKLNPRIPRIWDVATLPEQLSVASTEFVVLLPRGGSTALLWSALSDPQVSTDLSGLVAGTSGSHQRVKPSEMLQLQLPDPRTLDGPTQESISAMGTLASQRRLESRTLAATRDELLPLLMSGKIRVKDAEKATEGVL